MLVTVGFNRSDLYAKNKLFHPIKASIENKYYHCHYIVMIVIEKYYYTIINIYLIR